jgi:Arc/MetJ family transcription regulator
MRTNIILNDELVQEAQRYSRTTSKSALVEEALRTFVEVKAAEERKRTYKQRLLGVRQALADRSFRQSASDLVRQDRERP